jgi:hypothetical protein
MTTSEALGRTAILLATATLAVACTASSHSKATPPTGHAIAGSAVAEAEQRMHCGQHRKQASIPLPVRFVADAAVLCDPAVHELDGRGHAVYVERVADRGLSPLVAALRRPSERPTPGMICAADLVIVPSLLLIGQEGNIVRPVIPHDACGQPQQQVLDALRHVPWVTAHSSG